MTDENPKLKALLESLPEDDKAALAEGGVVPQHLVAPLKDAGVDLIPIAGQVAGQEVQEAYEVPDEVLSLLGVQVDY